MIQCGTNKVKGVIIMTDKQIKKAKKVIRNITEIPLVILTVLGLGGIYGVPFSLILGLFVNFKFSAIALMVYVMLYYLSEVVVVEFLENRILECKWSEDVENSLRGWFIYACIYGALHIMF